MIIGTIKEVKDNENRVALLPEGVKKLVKAGNDVFIQKGAGINSDFTDTEYRKAGAKILQSARDVVKKIDILIKVKEPIPKEYSLLKLMKGKTLFTFLHLAAVDRDLTKELMKNNITAIAYETVEDKVGRLPLLKPMSEVAGVLATQYGAQYLQKKYKGRGLTLGTIENTEHAVVVVLGGGIVGRSSALTAAGLGCKVTIIEKDRKRFAELRKFFKRHLSALAKNISIVGSNKKNIVDKVKTADLLVGAVLLKGAKAPRLVDESLVKTMKKGAVIVDVAIDQGGCIWGSRPTSHSNPIYRKHDKIFCCITNMPGQVSRQSSQALTHATLPYILKLSKGIGQSMKKDKGLAKGVNTYDGWLNYRAVAEALNMKNHYVGIRW